MTKDLGASQATGLAGAEAPEPPSRLGPTGGIPCAWEQAARAIAGHKRGMDPNSVAVDRVWTSYVGQARAALEASWITHHCLRLAEAHAEAIGMMDGFGAKYARQPDVDAREIRRTLGEALPPIEVGDLMSAGMTGAEWEAIAIETQRAETENTGSVAKR